MKCIYTVFAMLLVFISVIAPTAANEADWMPDANLRTTGSFRTGSRRW